MWGGGSACRVEKVNFTFQIAMKLTVRSDIFKQQITVVVVVVV